MPPLVAKYAYLQNQNVGAEYQGCQDAIQKMGEHKKQIYGKISHESAAPGEIHFHSLAPRPGDTHWLHSYCGAFVKSGIARMNIAAEYIIIGHVRSEKNKIEKNCANAKKTSGYQERGIFFHF